MSQIKVVYMGPDSKMYKRTLSPDQYTTNSLGQIYLPKDHYSRGYCERMTGDYDLWESLPEYPSDTTNPQ